MDSMIQCNIDRLRRAGGSWSSLTWRQTPAELGIRYLMHRDTVINATTTRATRDLGGRASDPCCTCVRRTRVQPPSGGNGFRSPLQHRPCRSGLVIHGRHQRGDEYRVSLMSDVQMQLFREYARGVARILR